MRRQLLWEKINCPYCWQPLHYTWNSNQPGFGVATCECDTYPIFDHILWLQKDDAMTHRVVVSLIKSCQFSRALHQLLAGASVIDQTVAQTVYLTDHYLKWKIPLPSILTLMSIVSRRRSWYQYLLRISHKNHHYYQLAAKTITRNQHLSKRMRIVVDVGAGYGFFSNWLVTSKTLARTYNFILLEKSFVSLLFARLYQPTEQTIWICTNVEIGLPVKNGVATDVVFIDSFPWIQNKPRVISEVARILLSKCRLSIINTHPFFTSLRDWGYGIPHADLHDLLRKYFRKIDYFRNYLLEGSLDKIDLGVLPTSGYSCLAQKK